MDGATSDAQLIASGLQMVEMGLVTGTEGNLSVRRPEGIRITPSSIPYGDIGADDLVTVGFDGTMLSGHREPSSELPLHVAIYAARPEVDAIVHTHSPAAAAWSERGEPLPAMPGGEAVLTAPPAPPGTQELAEGALLALGPRTAMLLAGHGVVAVGADLEQALAVAAEIEERALRETRGRP